MRPFGNSTHGLQNTRPKLTDEQKAELKVCFDLMDADGSGSIDADELSDAFELLGINLSRAEIQVSPGDHQQQQLVGPWR